MTQEMNPNQVVAWNLWSQRKARGWGWEEVLARLAENGVTWEKATYYAVEASRLPDKPTRRFSADELIAFALTFRKPVSWFLTPPDDVNMTLDGDPLYLRDLLLMGLNRDLPDLSPLAERLREVATAIETFEEERQPESGAAAIVRHVTGGFGDEVRKRRDHKENEELFARKTELARQHLRGILALEGQVDADELKRELAETLNFFSDVVPPPEEALEFIEEIRAEMAQGSEEKGSA